MLLTSSPVSAGYYCGLTVIKFQHSSKFCPLFANHTRQIPDQFIRLLIAFTLLLICLNTRAQIPATRNWVDTEVRYSDSTGKAVMVYNSLPKGGGEYVHYAGKRYSYVVFWTRVVNESASPVELAIHFPADSFCIFPSPESHIRIFLPPDTMTFVKVALADYGLNKLQSYLTNQFNKPGQLQRTLQPKDEYYFYVPVIIHEARGTARAAFVVKGQDLFYSIRIAADSTLIPCGQLIFKR